MSKERRGMILLVLGLAAAPAAAAEPAAPADPVYAALRAAALSGQSVPVRGLRLQRDVLELTLEEGSVRLAEPVAGRVWLGVFRGKGRMRLVPATAVEQHHLRLVTGQDRLEALEDSFETAVLVGTDGTFEELAAAAQAAPASAEDGAKGKVEDFQRLLRKELRQNLELRVLEDLYGGKGPGLFVARIEGARYKHLIYTLDPRGVEPGFLGPDGSGLYNADKTTGGWWYLERLKSEIDEGKPPRAMDRLAAEVMDVALETAIDKTEQLRGTAKLHMKIREAGTRVLSFWLDGHLRVEEVRLQGLDTPLSWIQEAEKEANALGVVLPEAATAGQELTLQLRYAGKDVLIDSGEGNFFVQSRTHWYPRWPARGAMWPATLRLCVPEGLTAVAIGELTGEEKKSGQSCTLWASKVPVGEIGFNYGKFKKVEEADKDSGLQLQVYTNSGTPDFIKDLQRRLRQRESDDSLDAINSGSDTNTRILQQPGTVSFSTSSLAKDALVDATNAARIYTAYFGPLPFRRVAITQQPVSFFGQAWPTLVYLPYSAFLDSYLRQQLGMASAAGSDFVEEVGGHEFAHQWWGHTVGWWTYRDQWISEGFSEFSSALLLEKTAGAERQREFWRKARANVLGMTRYDQRPNDAGPLSMGIRAETHKSKGAYNLMVYSKGGYVLHMLRMMLQGPRGQDDAFIATMRDFTAACRLRACSTGDFQAAVERHMSPEMNVEGNGKMDWFFRQWVYGMEVPSYELSVKTSSAGQGRVRIQGSLQQKGVSDGFRMLVPLYIDLGPGKTARIGRSLCQGTRPVSIDATLPIAGVLGVHVNSNGDVLAYD